MTRQTSFAPLLFLCSALMAFSMGTDPASACWMAQQNRIIPLGHAKGSIWFLELTLHRDGVIGRKPQKGVYEQWRGKSWLRRVDKHGKLLPKKYLLAKVYALNTTYKRMIQRQIQQARKRLKLRNSPRYMRFSYCNFKKTCRAYRIQMKRPDLQLRHRKSTSTLAQFNRKYLKKLAENHQFRLSASNRLVSLRTFWIGRHKFGLFQISQGGLGGTWRQGFREKNRRCRKAIQCIPRPLLLHHGKSIDLLARLTP